MRQHPCKPFRIIMSDGKRYEVRGPDMARVAQSFLLVGVGPIEDGVPDHCQRCYLDNIVTFEPMESAEVDMHYTGNPS